MKQRLKTNYLSILLPNILGRQELLSKRFLSNRGLLTRGLSKGLAIKNLKFKTLVSSVFLSKIAIVLSVFVSPWLYASQPGSFDWVSITFDNDAFVGEDNGYTNGIYATLIDVPTHEGEIPENDFWVYPLLWSMPSTNIESAVNIYSVGQSMLSPSDIKVAVPPENELPYSAMLAFSNSYITINSNHADRATTMLGLVGPMALGEQTQKFIHKMIGANEPQGWDTQLENELVFQFSRSRAWRTWALHNDSMDVITTADIDVGTISSAGSVSASYRFGSQLLQSFPTMILSGSRLANPLAVDQGWFFYIGANAGYTFNQIFTDGNTFKNSRSISYDKEFIGASAGLSKSWENVAFTFAVVDLNLIQNTNDDEALENLTRFGTMTFAWKL